MRSFVVAILATTALAAGAQAAIIDITLLPSGGNVAGRPGNATGWGFVLTDTFSNEWVVLTGSSFTGSPAYGTYVDYLSQPTAPLYIAGPSPDSSTLQQAWNPALTLGLGEFDIFSTTPKISIPGNLIVHYSVFSQDPNSPTFDPGISTLIADATISDAATVTAIPEPSMFALAISALGVLGLRVRRPHAPPV